jgi:hypothetical protein
MLSAKVLAPLLLLTGLVAAAPKPLSPPLTCRSCNPLSGQNECHPTTSCISTGKVFHCACRAGYKVAAANDDMAKHFRLPFKNYEFLVFSDPGDECNTLCDKWYLPPPYLCSEVKLQKTCPV